MASHIVDQFSCTQTHTQCSNSLPSHTLTLPSVPPISTLSPCFTHPPSLPLTSVDIIELDVFVFMSADNYRQSWMAYHLVDLSIRGAICKYIFYKPTLLKTADSPYVLPLSRFTTHWPVSRSKVMTLAAW